MPTLGALLSSSEKDLSPAGTKVDGLRKASRSVRWWKSTPRPQEPTRGFRPLQLKFLLIPSPPAGSSRPALDEVHSGEGTILALAASAAPFAVCLNIPAYGFPDRAAEHLGMPPRSVCVDRPCKEPGGCLSQPMLIVECVRGSSLLPGTCRLLHAPDTPVEQSELSAVPVDSTPRPAHSKRDADHARRKTPLAHEQFVLSCACETESNSAVVA